MVFTSVMRVLMIFLIHKMTLKLYFLFMHNECHYQSVLYAWLHDYVCSLVS